MPETGVEGPAAVVDRVRRPGGDALWSVELKDAAAQQRAGGQHFLLALAPTGTRLRVPPLGELPAYSLRLLRVQVGDGGPTFVTDPAAVFAFPFPAQDQSAAQDVVHLVAAAIANGFLVPAAELHDVEDWDAVVGTAWVLTVATRRQPTAQLLVPLFLEDLERRRGRGRPPWRNGDAPQELLQRWVETGAQPAELDAWPLRLPGPRIPAADALAGLQDLVQGTELREALAGIPTSVFQDGQRFHWDAPLNSYATGADGRGLYVWDGPGAWQQVLPPEDFAPADLDAFRVDVAKAAVALHLV